MSYNLLITLDIFPTRFENVFSILDDMFWLTLIPNDAYLISYCRIFIYKLSKINDYKETNKKISTSLITKEDLLFFTELYIICIIGILGMVEEVLASKSEGVMINDPSFLDAVLSFL